MWCRKKKKSGKSLSEIDVQICCGSPVEVVWKQATVFKQKSKWGESVVHLQVRIPLPSFTLFQSSFFLATTSGICISSLQTFSKVTHLCKVPLIYFNSPNRRLFLFLFSPSQHFFEYHRSASIVSFSVAPQIDTGSPPIQLLLFPLCLKSVYSYVTPPQCRAQYYCESMNISSNYSTDNGTVLVNLINLFVCLCFYKCPSILFRYI